MSYLIVLKESKTAIPDTQIFKYLEKIRKFITEEKLSNQVEKLEQYMDLPVLSIRCTARAAERIKSLRFVSTVESLPERRLLR